MTVFVYVNTSKQVGDADHVKVFANVDAAEKWFEENDPEASRSSMSFLNERHRPPRHYVHDAHRGARSDLESARSLIVMSGLTRIPDSRWTLHHVRKVPKAEKLNAIICFPLCPWKRTSRHRIPTQWMAVIEHRWSISDRNVARTVCAMIFARSATPGMPIPDGLASAQLAA